MKKSKQYKEALQELLVEFIIFNMSNSSKIPSTENMSIKEEDELFESLPKENPWLRNNLYLYQGFWNPPEAISDIRLFQKHFQAKDSDIILATNPKSGTTWLKALAYAIVNRSRYTISNIPLHSCSPHDLVPFFEYTLYTKNKIPDLSLMEDPRIFATHVPLTSLPESVNVGSDCKIVYLCRNPFDHFVSSWHFVSKLRSKRGLERFPIDVAFDTYCRGAVDYGPFWDHVVGYWKESRERPQKVLFLKYEDMIEDTVSHIKKLGGFLGFPFSPEEERGDVIEGIAELCSFKNLSDMEVNKTGKNRWNGENNIFFRKGEVGDWINHLTPSMAERLHNIMEEKLGGSGLTFKTSLESTV